MPGQVDDEAAPRRRGIDSMAIGLTALWLALAAVWIAALPGGRARRAGSLYPLAPCAVAAAWFALDGGSEAARLLALALAAALAIWALLTLVWLASLVLRDASIMDIAYPLTPLLAAAVVAVRAGPIGVHGWITLAACAVWALRLALHIAMRNLPHGEDARYRKWRARFGTRWWWWSYFQVFLLQGVLVWGWALPLVFALAHPAAAPAWNDALGLLVLGMGVAFEAGADWQLARHRADPARRGTVLQSGLWALSRHPNYFGEALVWWGFFLFALSHPWGWISIASPLYVTWFMNQGSATRMTDAYLHKRRPDYAAYAARVPAFWPRLWR